MLLRGSSGGGGGRGRGQGGGRGQGQGGGRGMGRGGGRGMRRSTGMEATPSPVESPHYQPHIEHPDPGGLGPENPGQEIEMLRAQADTMMAQLQTVNARISVLQGGNALAPTDVADTGVRRKTSNATRGGRMAAIVDKEECVSCGICAGLCPEEAITLEDTAVINPQRCTGCGICVDECPNEAISLVKLEEVAL